MWKELIAAGKVKDEKEEVDGEQGLESSPKCPVPGLVVWFKHKRI
jgi:hypothetical protein